MGVARLFARVVPVFGFVVTIVSVLPVRAATLIVDRSGDDGYPTIQAAIDDANDGDIIIVPMGTYSGEGNTELSFRGKAITVRGTDPNNIYVVNETIISCNQNRGVYFHDNEGPDSVLDGFMIRDGRSTVGGAISCSYANPTISHCTFTNNKAEKGGAVYLSYSNPVIFDCYFKSNGSSVDGSTGNGNAIFCTSSNPIISQCRFMLHSGNALANYYGSPAVTDCTFARNSDTAVWNSSGNGVFLRCLFEDNVGGAFNLFGGGAIYSFNGDIRIEDCEFINNSSMAGGGAICDKTESNMILVNCLFRGNKSAVQGGAVYSFNASPTFLGCTFTANTAEAEGGALFFQQGSRPVVLDCLLMGNTASVGGGMCFGYPCVGDILNCTLAGNQATVGSGIACAAPSSDYGSTVHLLNSILRNGSDEIRIEDSSIVSVSYSNITGGWSGVGNIDADPCFAESGYWADTDTWVEGDYTLWSGSPCIDTGDPGYTPEPNETDVFGKPRINGSAIDMGACEYEHRRIIYVDDDAGPGGDGMTWTTAHRFLQDALADANTDTYPDEIRIAKGTYIPDQSSAEPNGTGDPNATFQLVNGTTILGGYAGLAGPDPNVRDIQLHETILSGDLAKNDTSGVDPCDLSSEPGRVDNAQHVITAEEVDQFTILDGLTVAGGRCYESNPSFFAEFDVSVAGGGMRNYRSDTTVRNCTFIHNTGQVYGGAVYCYDSSPEFIDCTFRGNAVVSWSVEHPEDCAGGAVANSRSQTILCNCRFEDNYSPGNAGAVTNIWSGTEFRDCVFAGNTAGYTGGAVENQFGEEFTRCLFVNNRAERYGGAVGVIGVDSMFSQCVFRGNTARWGGAVGGGAGSASFYECIFRANTAITGGALNEGVRGQLANCILDGNKAQYGGALYLVYSTLELFNCTLVGNIASEEGGAIDAPSSASRTTFLSSCILRDNQPDQVVGFVNANFCNIQGMIASGSGNIDIDPLFADAGYWDLNEDPDDPNDDIWVAGDYHLKSELGRWDPNSRTWVLDTVTSPCIDAGDPRILVDGEPEPHGYRINMGAYGNASEASLSPFNRACIQLGHRDYEEWLELGQPLCWCYPRQCHGDADGRSEGGSKTGYSYVQFNDLNVLLAAWNVAEPPFGPGVIDLSTPQGLSYICADFARNIEGTSKSGFYRVHFSDLYMLITNWSIKEPPVGQGIAPDCGGNLGP